MRGRYVHALGCNLGHHHAVHVVLPAVIVLIPLHCLQIAEDAPALLDVLARCSSFMVKAATTAVQKAVRMTAPAR